MHLWERRLQPVSNARRPFKSSRELTSGNLPIALRHFRQALDTDPGGLTCRVESDEALLANLGHARDRRLQIGARIEIVGMLAVMLADLAGKGETKVGIDIDLAGAE